MSTFIDTADYYTYIEQRTFEQVTENNNVFINDAEDTAIVIIKDALYQYYKVDDIFLLIGTNRPRQVVRWVIVLAVYFLYERIPDAATPQRVIDNYKEVMETLDKIAIGKKSINLPASLKTDSSEPTTRFRWGSETKRSH